MPATAVESTTLAAVAFDPVRRLLQLEFRSGAVYQYFNVPEAVHQALVDAPSKGAYFNRTIRNRFLYRRLNSLVETAPNLSARLQR